MIKEADHLNSEIFKLRIRLGTPSTLDGKQLSTSWGRIKLVHERSQYMTHSLTTTVKTLGQICDQANKRKTDVYNNAFEAENLGESSRNEIQFIEVTLNQIKIRVSSLEARAHPSIFKV